MAFTFPLVRAPRADDVPHVIDYGQFFDSPYHSKSDGSEPRSMSLRAPMDLDSSSSFSSRARAQSWQPEPERCGNKLDEWGHTVANPAAYQAWACCGRRELLSQIRSCGGWRKWLLPPTLRLVGMSDRYYVLNLRWLTTIALQKKHLLDEQHLSSSSTVASDRTHRSSSEGETLHRRYWVAEQVDRDLPRTSPGHPREDALLFDVRDVLNMFCGARQLSMGYTQGLNFTAFLLCLAMSRDDAFWCLAALLEHGAPHLFQGGTLHGALVDCYVLQWLLEQLSPELAAHLEKIPGYSPACLFSRLLCTLLANCDLPGDSVFQIWRVTLRASLPRLKLLRIIAALFAQASPLVLRSTDLTSVSEAIRLSFEETYEIGPLLSVVHMGERAVNDNDVLIKIGTTEDRLRQEALAERTRRARLAAQRLHGGNLSLQELLRRLRDAWSPRDLEDKISGEEFGRLLQDVGAHQPSSGGEPCVPRVPHSTRLDPATLFAELDVDGVGCMPFMKSLLSLALLLGNSERGRIGALFTILDRNGTGRVSCSDFEQLGCLSSEIDGSERAKEMFSLLDRHHCGELDEREFGRALLALPSLATRALASRSPANTFASTVPSYSHDLSLAICNRPKWIPDMSCTSCQICGKDFNCFRRRHHCRACGDLVCAPCARYRVPLVVMGYVSPVRICNTCQNVLCPPRPLLTAECRASVPYDHHSSAPARYS